MGQKIVEHVKEKGTDKVNKVYRKTSQGDFERDVATDKLESLDNTVLIVDEAHNVTGNDYGFSGGGKDKVILHYNGGKRYFCRALKNADQQIILSTTN